MIAFCALLIFTVLSPVSKADDPVCDFTQKLIEDCRAVVTDELNLPFSVTLVNVYLELACSGGNPCINFGDGAIVSIFNTTIVCSEGTGGISFSGPLHVDSSRIVGCKTAIKSDSFSLLEVSKTIFENNTKSAMDINHGELANIKDCKFENNGNRNSYGDYGGGIRASSVETVDIRNTEFNGNKAYRGGGVDITTAKNVHMLSVLFDSNSADSSGGALHIGNGGDITIQNCKFQNNKASDHGCMLYKSMINPITILNTTSTDDCATENDVYCYGGTLMMDIYSVTHIPHINSNSKCHIEIILPE